MTAERFPENFKSIHGGEEFIRSKSIEAIEKSADMMLHVQAVEMAADVVNFFIMKDEHRDQDDLTIPSSRLRPTWIW